ncbi:nitroreductase family protein [Bradyrhizobium sp. CSA112]|uniref:nitroreductase family protein n=1 Tax=Bradyrhizobium sp. CSA112 TaxID=2699170 RepID=UPI0023B17B7C|nr:nitroreductase family protein [Bradyrhizobium sp. CSA112]
MRGQSEFEAFLSPLVEFNQGWARHAAALIYLLSRKNFIPPSKTESQFSRTHSFDCGAAWANFANQATAVGWTAHGMSGFELEKARTVLSVPEDFTVNYRDRHWAQGRRRTPAGCPAAAPKAERPFANR